MARVQPLARAPIVEALVDFRIQAGMDFSVERLEKSLEDRDFGYQKQGPILRSRFGFVVNSQTAQVAAPPPEAAIIGVRLRSADTKYVAQFTTEGFTLSRLEPYESWEALMKEAQRIWSEYQACVATVRIRRAATRFINNLRLPLKVGDRFERFLTGLPNMPPEYPQAISNFLQRFVIYDEPTGATAILTQVLDQFLPERVIERAPVILDIDVFRETPFPPAAREVWDFLAQLRDLKDRLFFGALTDEAVELYR